MISVKIWEFILACLSLLLVSLILFLFSLQKLIFCATTVSSRMAKSASSTFVCDTSLMGTFWVKMMFCTFNAITCELLYLWEVRKALTPVTLFNLLIFFNWLNSYWNVVYFIDFINSITFRNPQYIYHIKKNCIACFSIL